MKYNDINFNKKTILITDIAGFIGSNLAFYFQKKFTNQNLVSYRNLRNQAISHCKGDWIFSLDSDERYTIKAQDEIIKLVQVAPFDIYRVPRKKIGSLQV